MPYTSAYEHRVEKRGMIKGRQEGRLEGRQEGLREGSAAMLRKIVLSQLAVRFGPLDSHVQQAIAAATVDDLERQALALVEATSIKDVIGADLKGEADHERPGNP